MAAEPQNADDLPNSSSAPLAIAPGSLLEPAAPAVERYGSFVCGVFMLNMVLGTGPMSLPYAFNQAGFILSSFMLALMMGFSYMTCTFIIECLGTADKLRRQSAAKSTAIDARTLNLLDVQQEETDLPEITERIEIGALGEALIPGPLGKLAYIVLIIYAYGVLTVYVIAACASLSIEVGTIGGVDSYRIFVLGFAILVSPICLLDFQKTRPLQLCVGFLRILAVVFMFVVMIRYIADTRTDIPFVNRRYFRDIPWWRWSGLPSIFGNTAFSFMIHHSLPGLVFPLHRHASSPKVVASVYVTSYFIYITQGFLALWAFGDVGFKTCPDTPSHPCSIQGLFNTNFSSADYAWAAKFIVLYPVLVVSVFPLVAITLRNNLKAIFGVHSSIGLDCKHLGFTLLTVGPPFAVAALTKDVQLVLKYVGCYFGLGLMLLIPTLIMIHGRKAVAEASLGTSALRSRFGSRGCIISVLVVFAGAVLYSTVSFAMGH